MSNSKEKREPEHPAELESQFVLRLPEEPAKALRELLRSGDTLKNRLTIQIENGMRHGEVRFDHWLMHFKIVDLPTIIESLKTIDNKSFYKTADLCQMMICKEEPDPTTTDEESTSKNKKKDPYKVDKKYLWPHGITPPTKNVRKRRFRKTLKKKFVEAPDIEKEVKRLLRADNEAISVTWEVIKEEEEQEQNSNPETLSIPAKLKPEKKHKSDRNAKREQVSSVKNPEPSKVDDIFGGAVSDSDQDEENVNVQIDDRQLYSFENDSMRGLGELSNKMEAFSSGYGSQMYQPRKKYASHTVTSASLRNSKTGGLSSEEDNDYQRHDDMSKENMTLKLEQLKTELEELKQRRQRTQHEISGMENMALRQRFQDILHTLNQDIMFKDMEYQGMLTLLNSEDI